MYYKNVFTKFAVCVAIAVAIATLYPGASAAEIEAQFNASYARTDNVFFQPANPIEDDIFEVGANFRFLEETRRALININAVAAHRQYADSFNDQTVGSLIARINLDLVEDRFQWMIEDNYGQRMPNPLSQPTPDNQENVNIFSTGPAFSFPLGDRHAVGLEGKYSTVDYETSLNNSDRITGLVNLLRRSNASTTLSLNVQSESVTYSDRPSTDDFDVYEAFAAYNLNSDRNSFDIDLGYTELHRATEKTDGFLLRADWTRAVSTASEISLGVGSQYSNEGDVFRLAQDNSQNIGDTIDVDGADVPFRSNFVLARYRLTRQRNELSIEFDWIQDDYEYSTPVATPLDRNIIDVALNFRRDISRSLFLAADVTWRDRDYKLIDREEEDLRVGMTLGLRLSGGFSIFSTYRYFDRGSNDVAQEFTENRIILGVEYVPAWGRSTIR